MNYSLDRRTQVRWFGASGYDGAELALYESRYSLRTGVNATHQLTKKVGLYGGAQYAYSDFDGGGSKTVADVAEHTLLLSAGVSYQVLENLAVDASYNYSVLSSDDAAREFTRNNVSLGLTATF